MQPVSNAAPTAVVLTTKLYPVRPMPHTVLRPQLSERIEAGIASGARLTLLAAPAGSGKSTLLASWAASTSRPIAWLTLDPHERDGARFLRYLVSALQQIDPLIGQGLPELLQDHVALPVEPLLSALINSLAHHEPLVLVLEDYHAAESTAVNAAVAFLLAHAPPSFHLVIASRVNPDLPLARMRARGELREVRAADLRFTPEDAAAMLQQAFGVELPRPQLEALVARAEGWAAGLYLAGLSLQGRSDPDGFIAALTGTNRYIIDYLTDELLRDQPDERVVVLLQTSILDRMDAALVAALLPDLPAPAAETLATLERTGLLVVPLDPVGRWYRYHHLFGELLRQRLHQTWPEQVPLLHQRASRHLLATGAYDAAVQHAIASTDGMLIEQVLTTVIERALQQNQPGAARRWLGLVPPQHLRGRLLLYHGWIESMFLSASALATSLHDLQPATPLDQGLLAGLQGSITAEAGDYTTAASHYTRALELLDTDSPVFACITLLLLARATLATSTRLDAGIAIARQALDRARQTGVAYVSTEALANIASLLTAQGRHREALALLEAVTVDLQIEQASPAANWPFVLQATIAYLLNDMPHARALVETALRMGEPLGLAWTSNLSAAVLQAQIMFAEGQTEAALLRIDQVCQAVQMLPQTYRVVIGAFAADLHLRAGDIPAAAAWARDAQLSADHTPALGEDKIYLPLTRLLLAQGRFPDAERLLRHLIAQAQQWNLPYRSITTNILHALLLLRRGDPSAAQGPLRAALEAAAPQGYARLFLDEDSAIAGLLPSLRHTAPAFVETLLQAFAREHPGLPGPHRPWPAPEPLTEREIEVLHLMAEGLSNREIADRLVLAVGTVKRHIINIFGKLQVHSRTAAIARAREAGVV